MYRAGFIGASTAEVTDWVAKQVGEAKTICVPFTGSGRDVASMVGGGRTIESWDTQLYSKMIVEGVFASEAVDTNVDRIRYRKGYLYETRAIKNIDERCAGFIDWVAVNGTAFDKACLGSAIIRCTLMGRMTQWYANIEQLWSRFNKAREYNTSFVGLEGTFDHHFESFFDNLPTKSYDLMQVDPPKVVIGSDVYSANFNSLNRALGAEVDLPKWGWRDVLGYFRKLLTIDAEKVLFHYTSGVKPTNDEVTNLLKGFGTIEEEIAFPHRGRTDYAVVLRRNSG